MNKKERQEFYELQTYYLTKGISLYKKGKTYKAYKFHSSGIGKSTMLTLTTECYEHIKNHEYVINGFNKLALED